MESNSSPQEASVGTTTAADIGVSTTTSINIGQVLVYNFPAASSAAPVEPRKESCSLLNAIRQGHKKLSSYLGSLSNTSNPICRICHDGDGAERLVAPCHCSGTMGMVHVTCMERWLSSANADKCELCHYEFKIHRSPKPFNEWLRDSNRTGQQRSLIGDVICFFLLTPLAVVSGFLCIDGARQQVVQGNQMEAGSLIALSSVLLSVYIIWTALALRQ